MKDDTVPVDEQFADRLAELDQALAEGKSPTLPTDDESAQLRLRLARTRPALHALQSLRPKKPQPRGPLPERFGRFVVRKELGRGGFGVVVLAHDPTLHRDVALKVPHASALFSTDLRARFTREARAAAGLDHPNIVRVHEAGEIDGIAYIAASYCPGTSLSEWLRRRKDPVPFAQAAEIVAALADAVAHAHSRNVLHRDLKPANVLMTEISADFAELADSKQLDSESTQSAISADSPLPKITDFGLAKLASDNDSATKSGVILGTPAYMAPEQASGTINIGGPGIDIHALGAILYELITGQAPFRGESDLDTLQRVANADPVMPRHLRPRVPRSLETICLKCLRKEPEKRYASAADLAADLRRFLAGQPIAARPTAVWERAWLWCRRRPVVAGLAAALLLALVFGAYGIVHQGRLAQQQAIRADKERDAAQHAQTRAEANFFKAQEAVRRMTLIGQDLLRDPTTEVRGRAILTEALGYYQGLLNEKSDDPQIRLETARAGKRVGIIRVFLADPEAAEQMLTEAAALFEGLLAEKTGLQGNRPEMSDPAALTRLRRELAECSNQLGHVLRGRTRYDEAGAAYTRAVDLARQVRTELPDETSVQLLLANTLLNHASIHLYQSRPDEAERQYREVVDIQRSVLGRRPNDDPSAQFDLALGLDDYGMMLWRAGKKSEGEAMMREAAGLRRAIVNAVPANSDYKSYFARSLGHMAMVAQANGQLDEAEATFRESEDVLLKMTTAAPNTPIYQSSRAAFAVTFATFLEKQKRWTDAEARFRSAIEIRTKLAATSPQYAANRTDLAGVWFSLAGMLRKSDRAAEAGAAYAEGLEIINKLNADRPTDTLTRQKLARDLSSIVLFYEESQQPEDAESTRRRVLELHEQLVADFPNEPSYRRNCAAEYQKVAASYSKAGDIAEGDRCFARAIALRAELAERSDATRRDRNDLAVALTTYAVWLRNNKLVARAEEPARKALAGWDRLAGEGPLSRNGRFERSNAQVVLHNVAAEVKKDYREAETWLKQALEVRESLHREDPPRYAAHLARTLCSLGRIYHFHLRDVPAAAAEFEKAIAIHDRSATGHNELAWLFLTSPLPEYRRNDRALTLANRAVELVPADVSFWNTLALAQYRAGDLDAAIASASKAANPDGEAFALNALVQAMAHAKKGEKDEARAAMNRAVVWFTLHPAADDDVVTVRKEAEAALQTEAPKP